MASLCSTGTVATAEELAAADEEIARLDMAAEDVDVATYGSLLIPASLAWGALHIWSTLLWAADQHGPTCRSSDDRVSSRRFYQFAWSTSSDP